MRHWPRWPPLVVLVLLFAALRGPSLLEPAWYPVEGTYADIGRALTHGAVLYHDVWDSKPPGMYWIAALVTLVAGPGAVWFTALLSLFVALGCVAVWKLAGRIDGRAASVLATFTFLVLMSLPNLDGDLFNAQPLGVTLVLWAMVFVTGRPRWWCFLFGGVLVGGAMLLHPVFVIDLAVVASVPLWKLKMHEVSRRRRFRVLWIPVGSALSIGGACVALAIDGSLPGFIDVLVHHDVDYLQFTNGPGGSVVLSPGAMSRIVSTGLLVSRIGIPLLLGWLVARRWARRSAGWAPLLVWWLGCDLAGAMMPARGFPGFAQQFEGVLAIIAGVTSVVLWRRRGVLRRLAAAIVILVTGPLVVGVLFVPRAEVAAVNHDAMPRLENGNFSVLQLANYYTSSVRRLTRRESEQQYDAIFPYNANEQGAAVSVFRTHSDPAQRVFVWGTIPWAYALSDRLPAGRYVSLNTAYHVDPTAQQQLIDELGATPPAVMIVNTTLPREVISLLEQHHYRRIAGMAGGDDVWLTGSQR